MKNKTSFVVIVSVLFLFACKKHTDEIPAFSAIGFWKGIGYANGPLAIMNKPDGTTRLYLDLPGNSDTASSGKLDGTFIVIAGVYRSHVSDGSGTVVDIQSSRTAENYMDGVLFVNTGPGLLTGTTFEFVKQ